MTWNNKLIDLTGQTFGEWTVIERAPPNGNPDETQALWRCRCSCGAVRKIYGRTLRAGKSMSCATYAAHHRWAGRKKRALAAPTAPQSL
jgi:hypothetical protein